MQGRNDNQLSTTAPLSIAEALADCPTLRGGPPARPGNNMSRRSFWMQTLMSMLMLLLLLLLSLSLLLVAVFAVGQNRIPPDRGPQNQFYPRPSVRCRLWTAKSTTVAHLQCSVAFSCTTAVHASAHTNQTAVAYCMSHGGSMRWYLVFVVLKPSTLSIYTNIGIRSHPSIPHLSQNEALRRPNQGLSGP